MRVCVVGEYALGVKGGPFEVVRVDFTLSLKRREEAGDF